MLNKLIVILVLVCVTVTPAFCMNVPSGSSGSSASTQQPHAGGAKLTTQEIVLISVGAVCATVLLLALID
jgi:hypothetical protein